MNKLTNIHNEINELIEIIPQTVPTERIILFGSYVGGTPHKDSDIDIYVVINDNANLRPIEAVHALRRALKGRINIPMDLLAGHQSVFDERKELPTLERVINREGVVLYGN